MPDVSLPHPDESGFEIARELRRVSQGRSAHARPELGTQLRETRVIPGEMPNPIQPPSGCHFHPRCPKAFDRCKVESPQFKPVGVGHWAACHLNDLAG